ncbi:MAG TPA: hypothetical protein ENK85_04475 [Saprospiraceae bacterium]|nr:hypothetical protein [Saprospiraceae bacterium]
MLDKLFESFGGDVVNSIAEKAGIPVDQAKAVLPVAQESIQEGLMKEVTGGNVSGILSMFNSGSGMANNPIFGGIKQMFMSNMMSKLGLPSGVATMISGFGLENIMGKLSGILGDGGEVTESGLMDKLGLGGGLGDMAKNIVGDKLKDITGGLF